MSTNASVAGRTSCACGVRCCVLGPRSASLLDVNYLTEIAAAILAELPEDLIPAEGAHDLMLLYAILATTVGASVNREHVHDAWVAWMTSRGEQHEAMVPYEALAADVQQRDEPYADAIRRVATRLKLV